MAFSVRWSTTVLTATAFRCVPVDSLCLWHVLDATSTSCSLRCDHLALADITRQVICEVPFYPRSRSRLPLSSLVRVPEDINPPLFRFVSL